MPVWRARVDARAMAHGVPAGARQGRAAGRAVGRGRPRPAARHSPCTRRCRCSRDCWSSRCRSTDDAFPDVSDIFPAASRMQRAVLRSARASSAGTRADQRKWLRHAAWPADEFPLRKDFDRPVSRQPSVARMRSGRLPLRPRRRRRRARDPGRPGARGTIEPGHFRFSIVGEGVLRLEERLGYKHKGIEKRFEAMTLAEGARLAGRVSGDSTVAYAWAYAMAVEVGGGRHAAAARAVAARAAARARARRPAPVGPGLPRQRRGARVRAGAVFLRLREDVLRAQRTRCSATAT